MTRNVAMVVKQAAFGECDTRTWEWLVHKGFARKERGSFYVIQAAAEQSARVLGHQQGGRKNG